MTKLAAVLTTIQPPTDQVLLLAARLLPLGAPLIVAGDAAGPDAYPVVGCRFLSIDAQRQSRWRLAGILGERHYARKNLAYLEAIAIGATCLYETDDDTAPNQNWRQPDLVVSAERAETTDAWVNVYRLFTDEYVWPRGLPLDAVKLPAARGLAETVTAPIQQGLIDGNTDVDAIWRLIWGHDLTFRSDAASVALPAGRWCPFNSQSTWWWKPAFPLLYLPFHCSFRMTDIWRSFIAQACLWASGARLVFNAPDSVQVRNAHDLMRDFAQEVPGFTGNRRFISVLAALDLRPGADAMADNLLTCYRALVAAEFFPPKELPLVEAFVMDLADAQGTSRERLRSSA